MAETDILNPSRGFDETLGFNANWSYGTPRRTTSNTATAKARLGLPFSRDVMNSGYAFEMYFIDKPWAAIERVVNFYEQFKNGYFTIIDWDANGRHHVGRFTMPPNPQETQNGKYTVQGLLFEEVPTARMLQYPNDWARSSHAIYAVDDSMNPRVATYNAPLAPRTLATVTSMQQGSFDLTVNVAANVLIPVGTVVSFEGLVVFASLNGFVGTVDFSQAGSFTVPHNNGMGGGQLLNDAGSVIAGPSAQWIARVSPSAEGAVGPASYEMFDAAGTSGDFAQVQYVGWGFQMKFRLEANFGICDISLDGVTIVYGLDLSTGGCNSALTQGMNIQLSNARGIAFATLTVTNVPLNMHRVAITATGTKNANSSATSVIFPPLQVMH